jgi:dephospho-CoA kinase
MSATGSLRIGLTGGIGSGKSTVATLLEQLGARVIDSDLIARGLTLAGGAAIDAIRVAFGPSFIDASGALDRARMRETVFAEPAARERLEAILHPMIGIETQRHAAAAAGEPIVFDVPLLVESATWRGRVDEVWVVDCDEATQARRVAMRPGWTDASARAAIASQTSRARRRAAADAVIDNSTIALEELGATVTLLWRQRTSRT